MVFLHSIFSSDIILRMRIVELIGQFTLKNAVILAMMATAVNFNKAHLLDLSFLTPEERAKLEAVIKADQNLLR